jgi:hypothetical protein
VRLCLSIGFGGNGGDLNQDITIACNGIGQLATGDVLDRADARHVRSLHRKKRMARSHACAVQAIHVNCPPRKARVLHLARRQRLLRLKTGSRQYMLAFPTVALSPYHAASNFVSEIGQRTQE